MKCFQILNNQVLIINENQQYTDTCENFVQDGGSLSYQKDNETITLTKVIYDDQQKCCVVGDDFLSYPDSQFEDNINGIAAFVAAKEEREYVPPTLDELKEQALNYQYQLYEAQKHAIAWINDGSGYGFDAGPEDQNNWQVALTLMEDDVTMYRVYTNINDLTQKSFLQVTRNQMMEAGTVAKQQQYAAYAGFEKVKVKIINCPSAEELKPYLPPETA